MQIFHLILHRAILAAMTRPGLRDWLFAGLLLLALGTVAVPLGRRTGFLSAGMAAPSFGVKMGVLSATFLSPALLEELIFRIVPIPRSGGEARLLCAFGSLIVFVLYHPAKAWLMPTPRSRVFADGRFLTMAGLVGLACTAAYLVSDSLWPPVIVHWLAVAVWLLMLGGYDRMRGNHREAQG